MKKTLVSGLGPVLASNGDASNGEPMRVTRKQAQAWGDRRAKELIPKGFWHASIFETEGYFRVSFGGMEKRRR